VKHYTYTHSAPDGDVFYVGKGTDKRAFSAGDRSYLWHEKRAACGGITIRIVNRFESEEDAFADEMRLIKHYRDKGFTLLNKTDGGVTVSEVAHSPESNKKRSAKLRGYKYKVLVCPHCGKEGGATSIKRWHFDNCTGRKPEVKARVTVLGQRVYLCKRHTKEEARLHEQEFYELCMTEVNALKTISSGSRWVVL
jgi:hypothetical protein